VFVIDTSITMAWCFEDEATVATDDALERLRDEDVAVSAIWPLEVANGLLVAERRGRLSEAQWPADFWGCSTNSQSGSTMLASTWPESSPLGGAIT